MIRIAAFASGTGSNVANLIGYFKSHPSITVSLVVSNVANAGALEKAKANNIPVLVLPKEKINDGDFIVSEMQKNKIDYIILAGYLKMIPLKLTKQFHNKIINIHPSLLPKYGGKGMYGTAVHKAVFENKEPESGITIHFVNEEYDKGEIIAQKKVAILSTDKYQEIENKVRALEQEWFPVIIENVILSK